MKFLVPLFRILKLEQTKTSKKNQKTDFGMGEDERDVLFDEIRNRHYPSKVSKMVLSF